MRGPAPEAVLTDGPRAGRAARTARAAADDLAAARGAFQTFGRHDWLIVVAASALALVLVGVPTDMIGTPWFRRMIPIRDQDYVIWIATAVLLGLIVGTYARGGAGRLSNGRTVSGGVLTYLAVGCPICNKIVLVFLGTSGALTFFAPIQLYLGLASLALLTWVLRLRVRALVGACSVPTPRPPGLSRRGA